MQVALQEVQGTKGLWASGFSRLQAEGTGAQKPDPDLRPLTPKPRACFLMAI